MNSILTITDTKTFDEKVWQVQTEMTEEGYKDWFRKASRVLSGMLKTIDEGKPVSTAEIYLLGDISNIFQQLEVHVR